MADQPDEAAADQGRMYVRMSHMTIEPSIPFTSSICRHAPYSVILHNIRSHDKKDTVLHWYIDKAVLYWRF